MLLGRKFRHRVLTAASPTMTTTMTTSTLTSVLPLPSLHKLYKFWALELKSGKMAPSDRWLPIFGLTFQNRIFILEERERVREREKERGREGERVGEKGVKKNLPFKKSIKQLYSYGRLSSGKSFGNAANID